MLHLLILLFLKDHSFVLACQQGYYGTNCRRMCSVNCYDTRKCNRLTGDCNEGCKAGWTGIKCDQQCQLGSYDRNCLYSCSENCLYASSCNRLSGDCNGGCRAGWTGNKCDQQCQPGSYGRNCLYSCSVNCLYASSCNRLSGDCIGGCKAGWTGDRCDQQCQSGVYGIYCSSQCSVNCFYARQCDPSTGHCNNGCTPGWTGYTCDQPCQQGYYGTNCRSMCSVNCYDTRKCNRFTGDCNAGCKQGWTGSKCDRECQPGSYGRNCMYSCSENCLYASSCNRLSGYCNGGCKAGWTGNKCDQQCEFGNYGENCTGICSVNCLHTSECDRFTGQCKVGCNPGWTGSKCEECQQGHYGRDCSQKCSVNCYIKDQCDRTNGLCYKGCKPGWTGDTCDQNCDIGHFGKDCKEICSVNCNVTRVCDKLTGRCKGGCKSGWKGDGCDQECQHGHYGRDCSKACSVNCYFKDQCDRFTGQCDGGCNPGWTGNMCDQECSAGFFGANCVNQCSDNCNLTRVCDNLTGQCEGGCIPGWRGATCNDTCDDTYYGINCTQSCGTNCVNYSCNHLTGICNVYSQPLKKTDSNHLPGVIGGTTAAIIIIILFVVILVLYKRIGRSSVQKRTEQYTNAVQNTTSFSNLYQTIDIDVEENEGVINTEMKQKLGETKKPIKIGKSIDPKDGDVDIDEKIHADNPYGDFYANEEPLLDVDISYLANIIEEKSKKENDGFKKEYATLLYGEKYPCNVGRLPENIPKNRFKTTFPYDHSRVILTNKRADYINANYIDGIDEENMYIATQGPKQNTVEDFWLMIWQEDVKQVVMLTNLMEGTKWKCFQYWPTLQTTMDCGMFSIKLMEEKQYGFYITRKITVTNKKSKDDRRTVTQYHYTAWPDHGIPEPLCLLLFLDHVTRTKYCGYTGPILVHCSAGIGRTGTYIAIDVLSKAGKTRSKINIAEYVMKMRRNRMNMVQTYEQYKTIFLTLHEMFKAPPTVLSAAQFLQKSQTEIGNKPAFKKELQKLLAVRPQYTQNDYKVTSQFHDPAASIQPLDKYVLFLTSSVPKRGSYINAITVPSFTNQNAFIITNSPTQGDPVDFLRLITDYDSGVVICMEPLCNIESTSKWLSTSIRPKQVDTTFTVQLEHEQTTEIKSSKIEITKKGFNDKAWSVEIAEPMNGLKANTSKTVTHILGLVSFAREIETEGPIIVISRDGAAMCGVFCAVYNLIQQLTMDEEIDVFSVVRLLQTRRPKLCSTMEEYQLIHETLQSFIKLHTGENIYYNQ